MGDLDQRQTAFNSYTEYLETLLPEWPEYGWLLRFLRQAEPDTDTFLSIFDYSDDAVGCQDFRAGDLEWALSLDICAANVKLRVLLISFQYGDVARSMINHLGFLYDIDPLFFWLHFDQAPSSKASTKKDKLDSDYGPKPILSTSPAPQIGFRPFDHTSINLLESSILGPRIPKTGEYIVTGKRISRLIRNIVLIVMSEGHESSRHALLFERPSLRTHDSCHRKTSKDSSRHKALRTELISYKQQQISMLIEHPLSAVLPVLKLYISHRSNNIFQDIRRCEEDCPLEPALPGRRKYFSSLHALSLKKHHDSFRHTIRNIDATSRLTSAGRKGRRDVDVYLNDMRDIIQQIEVAQNNLARHHSIYTSFAALEDSHKSVRYADSVGRVTSLAFFFIPLSFITSIFGMNLAEFGTGEVRFWVVVATAVGLLIFVVSAWSTSTWVSRNLCRIWTRLDCFRTHYHCWKTLAKRKPRGGVWLAIFALTHTSHDYEWLLWVLDLRNIGNSEENLETPDQTMRETLLRRFLSEFWRTKALDMLQTAKGLELKR